MASNPFDQFDAPSVSSAPAPNPFDQFDAAPAQPGLLGRVTGDAVRGVTGGVTGLAGAVQAAGRLIDRHVPAYLSGGDAVDNYPIQQHADALLARLGVPNPTGTIDKIAQGAIGGVTGAALTGGVGLVPGLMGAAAGAAYPVAKAAGASDDTAGNVALATALLPAGAAGLAAGAKGVAAGADRAFTARAASKLSDAEAIRNVQLSGLVKGVQAASPGSSVPAASAAVKMGLDAALDGYGNVAKKAGAIPAANAQDYAALTQQANSHLATLDRTPSGPLAQIQGLPLPAGDADKVTNAAEALNTISGNQFSGNTTGPFTKLFGAAAPAAGYGASAAAALAGHPVEGLLGAAATAGGASKFTPAFTKVGQAVDRFVGTGYTPLENASKAAQYAVQKRGLTVPATDPLTDLRGATAGYSNPQQQFANTGGMQGSPADPYPPGLAGFTEPTPAPGAALRSSPPPGPPPGPIQGPAPQAPSSAGPAPGPSGPPVGGQALASLMHQDYFPPAAGHAAPSPLEINNAYLSAAQAGDIPQAHADAAVAGQRVPPTSAFAAMQHIAAGRGNSFAGAQPSQAALASAHADFQAAVGAQASSDVSSALTGTTPLSGAPPGGTPNGGDNPVRNVYQFQNAARVRQGHADDMAALAADPDQRQAILEIKATPGADAKAAIRDAYLAQNSPGANPALFTPILMKGK